MLKHLFQNQIRGLYFIVTLGIVGWTIILAGLYFWAVTSESAHHDKLISLKAAALGRQTQCLRRWVGGHGGIYVEVGDDVVPAASLSGLSERDIQTKGGRRLTLLNSPSLLRKIFNEFEGNSGDRIRLISYDPINPIGKPDPWEKSSLDLLQKGSGQVRKMVEKDGENVFRLLYPVELQPKCLRCHHDWKTTKRKVVGGLSVIVDKTPYDRSYNRLIQKMRLRYLGIWFFGILGQCLFGFYGAKLLRKIEFTSTHDKLTGLNNRGAIEVRLNEEIKTAERYNQSLSVLLLDIDHFKQVNDQYGHHIGDEALRIAGNILQQRVRVTDIAGRFGGEEFLILAPNTGLDASVVLAERILKEFRFSRISIGNKNSPISITASIGISSLSQGRDDAASLLKDADAALYRAKEQGRDRFSL
ncbi:MAG: diguanylate cyclase [Desulfobacter sp.]|nr:MAG: diguanylate cyclase [Desulfobacter sp.]